MSIRYNISLLLTSAILILFGGATFVIAQDYGDSVIADESDLFLGDETTFIELHLSPEGIYGVDI
ncbi:MAG: hypothetical protein GY855_09245, partial [candidate division Zixibacteria bacterium]|nr:hypothetical protein [candidate division Zixibacteria bacterium]